VNLQKMELQLAKATTHKNWPKLLSEEILEEAKTYNPSSAKVKRDWDKIEKDLEKEIAKEGDPLNEMFKQIYSQGDENTRKAMIKSFQTSGGPVL
jgi:suppressor of G2 allele of SKP1